MFKTSQTKEVNKDYLSHIAFDQCILKMKLFPQVVDQKKKKKKYQILVC